MLALLGKVNSLIAQGKYEESKELLIIARKLYPKNKYVIELNGLLNYNLGDYNVAIKQFKEVIKIDNKTYTCPYEGLGMAYYKTGKYNLAKENLIKSIEINPNIEFKKYNTLAKIYIDEGNYQRAQELLKKSIENYPYDNESIQLLKSIQKNLR